MNTRPLKARKIRLIAALFLAQAVALGGTLTAQSIGVETKGFGTPSGVPTSAVNKISICATGTSTQKMQLCLSGGTPGKTAGIAIGLSKTSLPLYSATLLVTPDLVLYKPFDQNGDISYTFPIPNRPGLRVYIQGVNADPVNPNSLFAMSSGLDVQIVKKQPPSTAFSLATADLLMDLAHEAYEYPKSYYPWERPRSGKLTTGTRLAGGFQILTKIQTPNPSSEPWFKKVKWPDTQVFVARNASCDIAVIFPGTDTNSLKDVVTDINFLPLDSGFHRGFRLAYLSVQAKLQAELKRVVNKHARVYITGHSLGGALAPVAAYHLESFLKTQLGVPTQNIVLYCFGGPRAMNAQRAGELGTRVPHHFAIVNKDDLVTHVPPPVSFTHIPKLRVFYPSHLVRNPAKKPWITTRGTMFAENGSQYRSATGALTPGVVFAHFQDEYTDRIRGVLPPPKVWLTVSANGNMTLNWTFPERKTHGFGRDFIALYKGDPKQAGTNGYLLNQWKFASASGSYETGKAKGAGFHVAYIQGYLGTTDRKFLATAGPYTWSKPKVSLSNSNGWVKLNWSIKDPGRYDYVALYNKNPWTAGPKGYLLGQWQWATKGRSWVSLRRWGKGYYIGYIEDDGLLGQGKVVAVSGPTK
jgi:hypothetical protein